MTAPLIPCLGCYKKDLPSNLTHEYHRKCSRILFGIDTPPSLDIHLDRIAVLARKAVDEHLGITGVQPKISLALDKWKEASTHRLKIAGLWGGFILKPPTTRFPDMPTVEDTTMHMAVTLGISTATHGLLRLKSGELAYISKRFDRSKSGQKIAVEDFCQLSGLLTERKYKSSLEKAGKIIHRYSSQPGLDAVSFFELSLFCYLTGNADMHLKNFSLLIEDNQKISLSPAYDLLSTHLMPIHDPEEVALTINGKKSRLKKEDFLTLAQALKIPSKVVDTSFKRLLKAIPKMTEIIEMSFIPKALQLRFVNLIQQRKKVFDR